MLFTSRTDCKFRCAYHQTTTWLASTLSLKIRPAYTHLESTVVIGLVSNTSDVAMSHDSVANRHVAVAELQYYPTDFKIYFDQEAHTVHTEPGSKFVGVDAGANKAAVHNTDPKSCRIDTSDKTAQMRASLLDTLPSMTPVCPGERMRVKPVRKEF